MHLVPDRLELLGNHPTHHHHDGDEYGGQGAEGSGDDSQGLGRCRILPRPFGFAPGSFLGLGLRLPADEHPSREVSDLYWAGWSYTTEGGPF